MGLHVAQQPLDRDERDDRRDDEADAELGPVLVADMTRLVEVEGLVGGRGEHGRDADQEREFGCRRPRVMPASIAAKIVAAEREVPGNTAATIWPTPTQNATVQVSASLGGWRLAYASIAKIAKPPRISAQATGATVSGSSRPICLATRPPTTVITNAAVSLWT